MNRTLVRVEALLLVRDPASVFSAAIPVFLLLGFGLPFGRDAVALVPTMVATAVGLIGLYLVPTTLASYRERGVLRRLSVTPLSPARLLGVQLVLQLVAMLLSCGLVLLVAYIAFGMQQPRHAWAVLVSIVLGAFAMLAVGLLIGALARDARTANGIGVVLFFPLAYLGGLILPAPLMPTGLLHVGDLTPLGALRGALTEAWTGQGLDPIAVVVLLVFTVASGVAAIKLFRWE